MSKKKLKDFDFFSVAECRTLLNINDTDAAYPKDKTIHQLLEEQVKKTPNDIAVVFEDQQLTYSELNIVTNQLARYIQRIYLDKTKEAIKPDVLIVICIERSLEMLIAILAILKAGAAYMPMDPEFPVERIRYILEDTQTPIVLTRSGLIQELSSINPTIQWLALDQKSYEKEQVDNLANINTPSDLVYVIYTSGTTGKPKGVMNTHRGLVNRLTWMQDKYQLTQADGILQKTSFTFDVSVWEFLWPLLNGARLVIAKPREHKEPVQLLQTIQKAKVTVLHFVPSMLGVFLDQDNLSHYCSTVRLIFCSGEPLRVVDKDRCLLKLSAELHNLYGPTEAAIDVTYWDCRQPSSSTVPIGKPISNTQLYILDTDLQPVSLGVIGELYIGGAGVARGYLNQPKLTAERFIPNPFASESDKAKGYTRLYKTGDLVRQLSDGNLQYIGRIDNQIKLRGYRIELEEIESVLSQFPAIKQTVVSTALREQKSDTGNHDQPLKEDNQYLVAYYVSEQPLESEQLRQFLSAKLPSYMIPVVFMHLADLPLTMNGKVDRKALPKPNFEDNKKQYTAPTTETEIKIHAIWEILLSMKSIGIADNFFSLGGDSILSIQLTARLRSQGLDCSVKDIFNHPTIEGLAAHIERSTHIQSIDAEQGMIAGNVDLLPIQHWFFGLDYQDVRSHNQSFLLQTDQKLNASMLLESIMILMKHHDALRLRYRPSTKESYIQYYENTPSLFAPKVVEFYLSAISLECQLEQMKQLKHELEQQLDFIAGPTVIAAIIYTQTQNYLALIVHHLIVDSVSWRIILQDLPEIYRNLQHNQAVHLAPKTSSYLDWSKSLITYAKEISAKDYSYWKKVVTDVVPLIVLNKVKEKRDGAIRYKKITWSKSETEKLLYQAHTAYHTTMNDLLICAFSQAIARWRDVHVVSFCVEGHGREECVKKVDVSSTVGWFTSMFPVVITLTSDEQLCIQSVKEQLHHIPDKGLSFGVLKYCHPDENIRKSLQLNLGNIPTFNYLGQFNTTQTSQEPWSIVTSLGIHEKEQTEFPHLFDLNGWVINDVLEFKLAYDERFFSEIEIARFAELFHEALIQIIQHCVSKTRTLFTPSDFPTAHLSLKQLNQIQNGRSRIEWIGGLSPAQEGLIFHALHAPTSDQYCVQMHWCHEQALDSSRLKLAWLKIIQHHPICRSFFLWKDLDEIIQLSMSEIETSWVELDWRQHASSTQHDLFEQYRRHDRQLGFDLEQPGLMRFHLIRLEDEKYQFLWTFSHIIIDGWSLPIIFNELNFHYEHHQLPMPKSSSCYRDYIEWISQQDKSEAFKFWQDQLALLDSPTDIKIQKSDVILNPNKPIKNLDKIACTFSIGETRRIEKFAADCAVTMSSLLQLAWAVVLAKYSSEPNVIYGLTVSGRSHPVLDIERIVGLVMSTLPIVISFNDADTVMELLDQVHKKVQLINSYSYCTLTEVQQQKKSLSGQPLFHGIFVFENYPMEQQNGAALAVSSFKAHEKSNYPYGLKTCISDGCLSIELVYDLDCFERKIMKNLMHNIKYCMQHIIKNKNTLFSELEFMDPREQKKIESQFNSSQCPYTSNNTIHQLFTQQALTTHNTVAIVCESKQLTYRELDELSNQLAHLLRETYQKINKNAIGPDILIGVYMSKSIDMIVSMLAILKSGAAYVPLDPHAPIERLKFMIADTNVQLIITQQKFSDEVISFSHIAKNQLVIVDDPIINAQIQNQRKDKLDEMNSSSHDLVYVVYTSGSTGKPKGVMVDHSQLINAVNAQNDYLKITAGNRHLYFTSISLDVSSWEIFNAILKGATLYIIADSIKDDPNQVMKFVEKNSINFMVLPPAFFNELPRRAVDSLNKIVIGGELCNHFAKDFWQNEVDLFNCYGPTETTVCTSMTKFNKSMTEKCIGKPLANVQFYVMDHHLQPRPIGAIGELYIGGASVARGYLNQPQLTAEKFIQKDGIRLYKTGDFVRWLSDGSLEYISRADSQIKLRGFRIELGEIEAVLSQHPAIEQAVVVFLNIGGEQHIVAYYVLSNEHQNVNSETLASYLHTTLPGYMIPSFFEQLVELPVMVNGKLDRNNLPIPNQVYSVEYVAPSNEVERKLQAIWHEIFQFEGPISVTRDFFAMGGHSILCIKLASKLHQIFDVEIPVAFLYTHRTIQKQGELVERISENTGKNPYICLQQSDKSSAIIFVHPSFSGAEVYYQLAKKVSEEKIFYGIQPYHSWGHNETFGSIKELAQLYRGAIKDISNKKSHLLGGWSFGAIVALEMGRIFMNHDLPAMEVCMIDPPMLSFEKQKMNESPEKNVQTIFSNKEDGFDILTEPFKRMLERQAIDEAKAFSIYQPDKYEGKVTLFYAKNDKPNLEEYLNYWKQKLKQVQMIELDMAHFEIFKNNDSLNLIATHLINCEDIE